MRLCRNLARLSKGTGEGRKEDSYRTTDAMKPAFTRFGHWKGTRHEDTAPNRLYLGKENGAALLYVPGMLVVLVEDHYCADPECDCRNVHLEFWERVHEFYPKRRINSRRRYEQVKVVGARAFRHCLSLSLTLRLVLSLTRERGRIHARCASTPGRMYGGTIRVLVAAVGSSNGTAHGVLPAPIGAPWTCVERRPSLNTPKLADQTRLPW